MSIVLGLTGSIGMGKSTTAGFFREAGIPVWDADASVHRLYSPGQPAALAIARTFPDAMTESGAVDRQFLRRKIAEDPGVMDRLNALVHPLVADDRKGFLIEHAAAPLIVLDVPLLFETGGDKFCDATLVVTAPLETQRARVLARGMSEAEFHMILDRQIPDDEKRKRATHVIETRSLDKTRDAVARLIETLTQRRTNA